MQRSFLLLTFLLGINAYAKPFLVSFPNRAKAPTQNPRNFVVCNISSLLKELLNIAVASTTSDNINMRLPSGIKYLLRTVAKVAGTAPLINTDNDGGANASNHLMETNEFLGFQNLSNLKQLRYEKA